LDKYCITGTAEKMIDGVEQTVTLYNYTLPMLIFACFGALAILFAFWLKHEDAVKGYGLEEPNMVEIDEEKKGLILDYSAEGNIAGTEILNTSGQVSNPAKVEYEFA
jgi:uncharacterized protein YuzE